MTEPPSVEVTQQELNRIYNAGAYAELIRAGDLLLEVKRSGHPAPERSGLPSCTRSQILRVYDKTYARIAVLHQYLLPNGSIGASGRPEPKALLIDGTLYYVSAHT